MEELILDNGVFLLEDKKEYKFGEEMLLEYSKRLYVKVVVLGSISFEKNGKIFRQFKIVK